MAPWRVRAYLHEKARTEGFPDVEIVVFACEVSTCSLQIKSRKQIFHIINTLLCQVIFFYIHKHLIYSTPHEKIIFLKLEIRGETQLTSRGGKICKYYALIKK